MRTFSRDRTAPRRVVALLAGATFVLSGCGGGDTGAQADPAPSSSGTGTTTPGSPSGSASASGASGVAPATGPLVDTSYFSMRAPKHYQVNVQGEDFSMAIHGAADIGIGIIAGSGEAPTLEQLARKARYEVDTLAEAPMGRTTVDGEPAYLLVASEPYHVTSEVGLDHDDHVVHLTVDSYGGRAQNLRLLRSMLASWQWK